MSILDRTFNIGKSEINNVIDKAEDPVLMTEQVIRDMKASLEHALDSEAELKAIALQLRATEQKSRDDAALWEKKTNDLLDAIESKKLEEAHGNELAAAAASKHDIALKDAEANRVRAEAEEKALTGVDAKIKELKDKIKDTEARLTELKAREKTAQVSERVNKSLSSFSTEGASETLKRMEEKVSADEFRARAYEQMGMSTEDTEAEINRILNTQSDTSALDAIKAKRAAGKQ